MVPAHRRDGVLRPSGHALDEHTLNIDFAAPALGPAARVAVELDADSALRLVEAVRRALASRPDAVS